MPTKKLAAIVALLAAVLLVAAACGEGADQPDDILDVANVTEPGVRSAQAALNESTTRDICTKCGCIATYGYCRCWSRKKLQCVLDGGPKKITTASQYYYAP